MTHQPEQQRRAIVRTAVILALIVLAIFAFTLWRGVR
jgi:small neutral amino acid transporter SnatA (MarC family)